VSHSEKDSARSINRRSFLCNTVKATLGGALIRATTSLAETTSAETTPMPQRAFGKTGHKLPVLGYGGAALVRRWANPLSVDERIELVRYTYQRTCPF